MLTVKYTSAAEQISLYSKHQRLNAEIDLQ